MFYKMTNNLTPEYLSSLIPASVEVASSYNLRNSENFRSVQCRTQLYYKSFLPCSIRDWNDLSDEIKSIDSIFSFKSELV